LEWGTVGEQEGGMGREREEGGQYTSNLRPGWTGIAPHTKEGFQVSERDLGTREGRQAKGISTRGIIKGTCQGVGPCALIMSHTYTFKIFIQIFGYYIYGAVGT
jgi:hypothetical protein